MSTRQCNNIKHTLRARAWRHEISASGLRHRLDRANQKLTFWRTVAVIAIMWSGFIYYIM